MIGGKLPAAVLVEGGEVQKTPLEAPKIAAAADIIQPAGGDLVAHQKAFLPPVVEDGGGDRRHGAAPRRGDGREAHGLRLLPGKVPAGHHGIAGAEIDGVAFHQITSFTLAFTQICSPLA